MRYVTVAGLFGKADGHAFQKKTRILLVFALRQQTHFGDDVSLETLQPLLRDLRDIDSFHCYTIASPPRSPSHLTRSQAKSFFRVENAYNGPPADLKIKAFDYWADLDACKWRGRHFMVHATIQDNHELVFALLVVATSLPLSAPLPVTIHPGTGSPKVRLTVSVAAGPDRTGHVRVSTLNFPRKTSAHVSIYEDALADYIKSAERYLAIMELYAEENPATTGLNVLDAYSLFIEGNRSLLFIDGCIELDHDIGCSNELRMLRERMRGAPLSQVSWAAAAYTYLITTPVFQWGLAYIILVLCNAQ